MTEETKQGSKASEKPAAKQSAPAAEAPVATGEARHLRAVHIANAKAAYGVPSTLVAAGIAILDAKGVNEDGYTKSEVAAAVAEASETEIQEG